jgi:phosphoribosylformimino-5-aminoimidazole carboxamide ribotide isomerase
MALMRPISPGKKPLEGISQVLRKVAIRSHVSRLSTHIPRLPTLPPTTCIPLRTVPYCARIFRSSEGLDLVMQIWPAIDLRGGKCVRLKQGDYARETVYGEDPAEMARHWVRQGASCLHLVDLDGARNGIGANQAAISAILAAVKIPCQLGGGIRDEAIIERLLGLGMARLVVGTKALKEPAWFQQMCAKYPHKLALGIDARDGKVATDGWLETSSALAIDFAKQFARDAVGAIIYTDIARDGMLQGPNLAAMAEMKNASPIPVIASGGVSTAADVAALARVPMAGAIIGRALYEETLTLPAALAAAKT